MACAAVCVRVTFLLFVELPNVQLTCYTAPATEYTHVSCPCNVYCPGAGCPHNTCKHHARHHQPRERANFTQQWRVTVLAVLDAIGALVVLGDVPLETASCRHNGRCRCFS